MIGQIQQGGFTLVATGSKKDTVVTAKENFTILKVGVVCWASLYATNMAFLPSKI